MVELSPAQDSRRVQLVKGGFDTAKAAADARAEVLAQHRTGTLPSDRAKTFGAWLEEWLASKVERGEIRDSTERGYRDNIRNHLKPRLGHRNLAELRGIDFTRAYGAIVADRQAQIVAAEETNRGYAEEAEQVNASRRAKGMTRTLASMRVAVPRPVSPASIARLHAVCLGRSG